MTFSSYHPIVNFIFFVIVMMVTMFIMHPCLLILSFAAAMIYSYYLKGKKALRFNLLFIPILWLIMAIANPLFTHQGVTILVYMNGNPITLESIVYGCAAATMFTAVMMWFSCYNVIMTSDKFIYLFGRLIPGASLILSMILRFVPKYRNQAKKISISQKCIGRDVSNGNIVGRARNGMKIISIMTTWALENGIETADSMKSRGYGLTGRTSFSIFRFDYRDKLFCLAMLVFFAVVMIGLGTGSIYIVYYPAIKVNMNAIYAVAVYLSFGILCFMPLITDIWEGMKWHAMRSKI